MHTRSKRALTHHAHTFLGRATRSGGEIHAERGPSRCCAHSNRGGWLASAAKWRQSKVRLRWPTAVATGLVWREQCSTQHAHSQAHAMIKGLSGCCQARTHPNLHSEVGITSHSQGEVHKHATVTERESTAYVGTSFVNSQAIASPRDRVAFQLS